MLDKTALKLVGNAILANLPCQNEGWTLSLDIKPLGYLNYWTNVIHFIASERHRGFPGSRIPAIFFNPGNAILHIINGVNGNWEYAYDSDNLPLNIFTNVKLTQKKIDVNDVYLYEVFIGGKRVHYVNNTKAMSFTNVTVYAANKWYPPANAMIKNVIFSNII